MSGHEVSQNLHNLCTLSIDKDKKNDSNIEECGKETYQIEHHQKDVGCNLALHKSQNNDTIDDVYGGDDERPIEGIKFVDYQDESQLESVMELVGRDLSEPYTIFTYRYFLHQWPELCILAISTSTNTPIGCVVCKIDEEEQDISLEELQQHINQNEYLQSSTQQTQEKLQLEETQNNNQDLSNSSNYFTSSSSAPISYRNTIKSGYMAMLAVEKSFRRAGIGSALVERIVKRMRLLGCTSVTLETEVSNMAAMKLYEERFGFIREELLVRYYLNWGDAYRLRLWFKDDDGNNCHEDNNETNIEKLE